MSDHDIKNSDKTPIESNGKDTSIIDNGNGLSPELNLELMGVDEATLQEIADIQAAIEADDGQYIVLMNV